MESREPVALIKATKFHALQAIIEIDIERPNLRMGAQIDAILERHQEIINREQTTYEIK